MTTLFGGDYDGYRQQQEENDETGQDHTDAASCPLCGLPQAEPAPSSGAGCGSCPGPHEAL